MNYLAHLYLSGEEEKIIVGNFIGDYVKGKNYEKYPEKIKQGILLHRQIDAYTDIHPLFREAKRLFISEFGLYSGIVVDFFYDHFLARYWSEFSPVSLRSFAKRIHAILLVHFRFLPRRVQGFLPFLIQNRRLESYASMEGIIRSLKIMSDYSSLPAKMEQASKILFENYDFLEDNFRYFFADVTKYVAQENKIIFTAHIQPS